MSILVYWGEEEFNIEKAVDKLKKEILDPAWKQLNHRILIEPNLTELTQAVRTVPLAFGNLLIEVRTTSLFFRGAKKSDDYDELVGDFIKLLENLNENVFMLFIGILPKGSGKKIDSSLKTTKAIAKIGKIVPFEPIKFYKTDDFIKWIIENATLKDMKINHDAALLLYGETGNDLRRLDSEIEKLKTFVFPQKTIELKDVKELSCCSEDIFKLADYWLFEKNDKAVEEFNKLLKKEYPVKLIASLQTTVRYWLRLKAETLNKKTPFDIARIAKQSEYRVQKDIPKLQKVKIETLVKMKIDLTNAEYKIKSGALPADIALQVALSRH
jgi:DNA polymerase III subunit delta